MRRRDDTPPADRPAPHVFDQTNGVLGDADEEQEAERHDGSTRPPDSFGVPPIVSL